MVCMCACTCVYYLRTQRTHRQWARMQCLADATSEPDCNLSLVIVEPRKHPCMRSVLHNVARVYGGSGAHLYIFHGTLNLKFVAHTHTNSLDAPISPSLSATRERERALERERGGGRAQHLHTPIGSARCSQALLREFQFQCP